MYVCRVSGGVCEVWRTPGSHYLGSYGHANAVDADIQGDELVIVYGDGRIYVYDIESRAHISTLAS